MEAVRWVMLVNYVDDYLQRHIDDEYSPYTQKLIACSLAKLYGCSTTDFIPTQARRRTNITRSRKCKNSGKGKAYIFREQE